MRSGASATNRTLDLARLLEIGLELPLRADVPADHDASRRFVSKHARPAALAAIDAAVVDVTALTWLEYRLGDLRLEQVVLAEHARRLLIFSYPPRNGVSRLLIGAQNLFFRLRRMEFRTFAHPPARMLAVVEEHGLRRVYAHHPLVSQVAGFER